MLIVFARCHPELNLKHTERKQYFDIVYLPTSTILCTSGLIVSTRRE